jgi:RNA polymerase sigma-70 factor (ECF subfamily)
VTSDLGTAQSTTDAFAEFVRPHWDAMARLARRLCGSDWEDVLQDALALAWRTRARFDPERGTERTWLLTLTADQARKHRRRSRTHLELVDEPESSLPTRDLDIERAIAELSERQRLAVELFYFLDLSVRDIAAVLSCSEGTVKSTLSDARQRLRASLGGEFR